MSRAVCDPRDRAAPNSSGYERLRFMARSGGFVMCRQSRQTPIVLTEKQWARLPIFNAEIAAEYAAARGDHHAR